MQYKADVTDSGKVKDNITVDTYSGFGPRMTDYHSHTFYEISLIKEGEVTVFLPDVSDTGSHSRIVLLRPRTPHFIMAEPEKLYSRTNVLFSNEFIADSVPEWESLSKVFGKNGNVIELCDEEYDAISRIIAKFEGEPSLFRKKLMLLYLLSVISDLPSRSTGTAAPDFVTEAVSYLTENCKSKITADDLAAIVGVGRTTLMMGFKKYMGVTMNDYLVHCRLKHAVKLIRSGVTIADAAEECGYSDSSALIRAFKKMYKVTPMEYIGKKVLTP